MESMTLTHSDIILIQKLQVLRKLVLQSPKGKQSRFSSESTVVSENAVRYNLIPQRQELDHSIQPRQISTNSPSSPNATRSILTSRIHATGSAPTSNETSVDNLGVLVNNTQDSSHNQQESDPLSRKASETSEILLQQETTKNSSLLDSNAIRGNKDPSPMENQMTELGRQITQHLSFQATGQPDDAHMGTIDNGGVRRNSTTSSSSSTSGTSITTHNVQDVEQSRTSVALHPTDLETVQPVVSSATDPFHHGSSSSYSSRSSGSRTNMAGLENVQYSFDQFCNDLDLTDEYTLKLFNLLIHHTKEKAVISAIMPVVTAYNILDHTSDSNMGREEAPRSKTSYDSQLREQLLAQGLDPAKSLALFGFGSRALTNDQTTPLFNTTADDNTQSNLPQNFSLLSKNVVYDQLDDDYFSYHPKKTAKENKGDDFNSALLDTPTQKEDRVQMSSSVSSVSSNSVLDYYPAESSAPQGESTTNLRHIHLSAVQLINEALLNGDSNLPPIAAEAVRRISQPNIYHHIHNAFASSPRAKPAPAPRQFAPNFNQQMFGSNGAPNSFRSESDISSLHDSTPHSIRNLSEGILNNEQHTLLHQSDDSNLYQPPGTDPRFVQSQAYPYNYTHLSGEQNPALQRRASIAAPLRYREESFSSVSSGETSSSMEENNDEESEYQPYATSDMGVSRRGSMWDAYNDPSMEGLVVQEIEGVAPSSWDE